MKKKFLLSVLIIALFSLALPAFAADYVEGQLMVTIAYSGTKLSEMPRADAKNAIAQKAAEVAAACGGTAKCYNAISISQNKIVAVITSKTKTTAEMQAICNARKDVLSAKPNRIYRNSPRAVPKAAGSNAENATAGNGSTVDDPLFPEQWALCGTYGLKATAVWGKQQGSADVVVAIVDGGVDFSHEDLAGNIAVLKQTDNVTVSNAKLYRIENTYIGDPYIDEDDSEVAIKNERLVQEGDNLPLSDDYPMTDESLKVPSLKIDESYNDLSGIPDHNGHGSHIAGIIAAVTNNGKGMAGLARGCKIAAFSVASVNYAQNSKDYVSKTVPVCICFDNAGLNAAWDEMVEQKEAGLNIRVANASYGDWKEDEPSLNDDEYLALKAASDAGIIICVAAGNEKQDIDNPTGNHKGEYEYPVCYKAIDEDLNMIVVGATKSNGEYDVAYSNWGAKSVDIAAPGTQVYGAVPKYEFFNECDKAGVYCTWAAEPLTKEYSKGDGTSFATPYVAASAALLCSHYPDKSAEEIIKLLYDNADTKFKGTYTTYGNLNIARALNATSDSSSSGCNTGFGALALLFVIALPVAKKYSKKAA